MNNVNASNATLMKQASAGSKEIAKKNPPINTIAMGFLKSVGNDKKLSDLSNKLQNIDEKTLRDFAKHLNGVGNGTIISEDTIEKAIKGLKYEGKELPELSENNPELAQLDEQIKHATQKMLTLNSASLIINPNLILHQSDEDIAILPIPILTSQEEKIGEIFQDEKMFAEHSKLLLPKAAQEIFDKNYPILRDNQSPDMNSVSSASKEDTNKINNDIVDSVSDIYQMVTIRFLAQLGNVPAGLPNLPTGQSKEPSSRAA